MPGVVIALQTFFQGWTDSLSRFWLACDGFITGSGTVLTTLNGTAPVWGTTLITWVVQWVPVPVRLLLVFLVGTWVVGFVESVVEYFTLHVYHRSFINAMGKRVGGFWTRGNGGS
jgi:hypothetical protein